MGSQVALLRSRCLDLHSIRSIFCFQGQLLQRQNYAEVLLALPNKNCGECAIGYYRIPQTQQCEDFCPSGVSKTPGLCDHESRAQMCFTFSDKPMPPTALGVTLISDGSEENSPIPAYDRGYYFDGDDFL